MNLFLKGVGVLSIFLMLIFPLTETQAEMIVYDDFSGSEIDSTLWTSWYQDFENLSTGAGYLIAEMPQNEYGHLK